MNEEVLNDDGIPLCFECRKHLDSEPMLVGAFASVGIEHGKSTWEMARDYFAEFHGNGHRPAAGGDTE